MAVATFKKPAQFAPTIRLPSEPAATEASKLAWKMPSMMPFSLESTSSKLQLSRSEFWLISRPEVATPPALAAFAGPYRIPLDR